MFQVKDAFISAQVIAGLYFHSEGKRGYAQLDGDEIVYGESKGDKVMVNTGGSIYLGKPGTLFDGFHQFT